MKISLQCLKEMIKSLQWILTSNSASRTIKERLQLHKLFSDWGFIVILFCIEPIALPYATPSSSCSCLFLHNPLASSILGVMHSSSRQHSSFSRRASIDQMGSGWKLERSKSWILGDLPSMASKSPDNGMMLWSTNRNLHDPLFNKSSNQSSGIQSSIQHNSLS